MAAKSYSQVIVEQRAVEWTCLRLMDTLSQRDRSQRMALVKSVDTGPELLVRRLVHAMGFRYRLHAKNLPGRPDMVFARFGCVIFVHGCFWHRHRKIGCPLARMPKSRIDFWEPKLEANRTRDQANKRALRRAGWRVLEVWECQLRKPQAVAGRIRYFLENEVT